MIKELNFRPECYDNEDFVNEINECIRALNNLESLITSHISSDAMSRLKEPQMRSDDTRHTYSGAQPPRADNTGSPKLPSFEEVWNFVCNLDVEASGKPSVIMKYICHRFYEYIERQLRAGA